MKVVEIHELYAKPNQFEYVNLVGWVVSNRKSGKNLGFLSINDGSCFQNLQVVYKQNETLGFDEAKIVESGAAIQISGVIKITPNALQPFELVAKEIVCLASCKDFPLQKKEHTQEFLRTIAHLRHRSKYHRAMQLVRNELCAAIHQFFYQLNFLWLHAPIITGNDSEGAGETFSIITNNNETDFFKKQSFLSVSSQLHAEAFALGFKKVYSFGPTFRAEKSFTNRHAAEFWMLEPEISFATLEDDIVLIESLLKHLLSHILQNCVEELKYFEKIQNNPKLISNLKTLINSKFKCITYQRAIEILQDAVVKKAIQFENSKIEFGVDLKTEHERYLAEQFANGPIFIRDYPKNLKAFYMKINEDNQTVAATDLLVPGVGELVGGSEREYRYDVLKKRCEKLKIPLENLRWYLDLRKFGYYRSAGFGLGFDRLLMYITGADNIKDTIPFPRTYQQMNF